MRSPGEDPSDPVCDMFRWAAMSALWSCAALVSFSFRVRAWQPTLARSPLTSCTILAVTPDAVAVASGVLGAAGLELGAAGVALGVEAGGSSVPGAEGVSAAGG